MHVVEPRTMHHAVRIVIYRCEIIGPQRSFHTALLPESNLALTKHRIVNMYRKLKNSNRMTCNDSWGYESLRLCHSVLSPNSWSCEQMKYLWLLRRKEPSPLQICSAVPRIHAVLQLVPLPSGEPPSPLLALKYSYTPFSTGIWVRRESVNSSMQVHKHGKTCMQ